MRRTTVNDALAVVCSTVANAPPDKTGGMGHISWEIGSFYAVALALAKQLSVTYKRGVKLIELMIARGWLWDRLETDLEGVRVYGALGMSHEAWLAWPDFDVAKCLETWGEETIEEWKEWDGVDGTDANYDNRPVFDEERYCMINFRDEGEDFYLRIAAMKWGKIRTSRKSPLPPAQTFTERKDFFAHMENMQKGFAAISVKLAMNEFYDKDFKPTVELKDFAIRPEDE